MRLDPASAEPLTLTARRMHEAEGFGRRSFALFQAARHPGPLIWVLPAHAPHLPMLRGLPDGVGDRLHVIRPKTEIDLLWSVEEALRAAPVGLVIAEPDKPLSLLAGRRLQLAAEAGKTTGLMLIREGAGSNAAETRWNCAPLPKETADSTLHGWSLKKNKKGTLGTWTVTWNGATTAFNLVCATGERYQPAQTPH